MISPGPCLTHPGVRVSVGVKVREGMGVSEGGAVDVFVGKNMGVRVAGSEAVCEGSRLGVQVGVNVGVRGTMRLNPPHAMRNKVSADIPARTLLVIVSWQHFDCVALSASRIYNGWFRSQRMRRPSSVSQGAMIWITSVSWAMIAENPPVAITFISVPSSLRKRSTMPSTMLT